MKNRHFIMLASFCMLFPGKTFSGSVPAGSLDVPARHIIQNASSAYSPGIYSAPDDKKMTSGDNAAGDGEKVRGKASGTEVETHEEKAPEKVKQRTPFVPSEKIPADQGVDFPYDI
jgi:hypothetical protein